ncbi:hypothetical protein P43SY_006555 [Pythium insidiosum]|uniref:WD40 repeat-containing protein SMU1 n=1 Tax=Pythium insidiosum TaxID=114742 RepID=A0AAD5LGM8_PYTIN|nr:hypothetical protein P43SY_006555 [Pythium insidiosum]
MSDSAPPSASKDVVAAADDAHKKRQQAPSASPGVATVNGARAGKLPQPRHHGHQHQHQHGAMRKSVSDNSVSRLAQSSPTAAPWAHVGYHRTTIPPAATFDADNEQIRRDMLRMIVQYLQHEGFSMSSATIQDEANVKLLEKQQDKDALRRMTKAILEGDWDLVAKLINKHLKKYHSQQGFLYAVCKQEYLELIDRQEYQKAFTFLTTHLKPLEKISNLSNRHEFKDLCYLLTCKSVGEVDAFRDWEGVVRSREKLVEQLRSTFELDELLVSQGPSGGGGSAANTAALGTNSDGDDRSPLDYMPENRLMQLLHQSVAYQMEFSRYHPKTVPKVTTLLQDFEFEVLPNCVKSTYVGHAQNVKYVTFVGRDGEFLASGSSDAVVKLWPVEFPPVAADAEIPQLPFLQTAGAHSASGAGKGEICKTWCRDLKGHSSRIWYVTSNGAGDRLFSASGDGTVKIWDVRHALTELSQDMLDYVGETTNDGHPAMTSFFSITTGENTNSSASRLDLGLSPPGSECIATLGPGHGDIYSVNLHPSETHVVTGGYDQTVRLFDITTGSNIKTFRGHVASVCDVQFNRHANLLVSGSKDGTIRLWDILSGLCVHTLRQTLGEVTSVSLASNGFLLLTGSRNNSNRLWDMRMLSAPRVQFGGGSSGSSGFSGGSSVYGGSGSGIYGGGRDGSGGVSVPSSLAHSSSVSSSALFGSSGSSRNLASQTQEHKPIQRFKGHQNTAKNIVRVAFGPREAFVLGGSEDGCVYVWDVATGKLLERLAGHQGVTYNAKWHERQALMASSSHDGTVKTWWWQDGKKR